MMKAQRVASLPARVRSLAGTETRKPTNPVSVEPGPAQSEVVIVALVVGLPPVG